MVEREIMGIYDLGFMISDFGFMIWDWRMRLAILDFWIGEMLSLCYRSKIGNIGELPSFCGDFGKGWWRGLQEAALGLVGLLWR